MDACPADPDPVSTVVVVVADTKYDDLREPIGPIAYFPLAQETEARRLTSMRVFVRSRLRAAELRGQIVDAGHEINPSMVVKIEPLDRTIGDSLLKERLMAALSGFFGALAALLALLGLYGVMAYVVARRRHELG